MSRSSLLPRPLEQLIRLRPARIAAAYRTSHATSSLFNNDTTTTYGDPRQVSVRYWDSGVRMRTKQTRGAELHPRHLAIVKVLTAATINQLRNLRKRSPDGLRRLDQERASASRR
jgi:hypothetical protein